MFLYRRPLHPELFPLKGRKSLAHGAYELEGWIMPGAHLLRFRVGAATACELIIDHEDGLPVDGAVTGFACTNEHEFTHKFAAERIGYTTSVQVETLGENLYKTTYEEMLDYVRQTQSLSHKWQDSEGRKYLSLIDLQRLNKEVHCQGYHLMASTGLVLRTQTIFEVL